MTGRDEIPAGFGVYRPDGESYGAKHLLLPAWLNEEISASREARKQRELIQGDDRKVNLRFGQQPIPPKRTSIGEVNLEEEDEELRLLPRENSWGYEIPVFARDEPLNMLRRAKQSTPDRDRLEQLEGLYLKLKKRGRYRAITPGPDWRSALARLDQSNPHFAAVTQVVRERLMLAEQSGRPAHIPPLLLSGIAGVGKTHYAKALASAVGTSYRQLQLDTPTSDTALMGNEKRWANTAYGVLFEEVVLGEHANPVIVLDEIDKALRDKRSDPLAPLHSVLERVTSCRTRDVSLDFEFDASNVIWVATANDPWLIPQPLRTRMKEFTIRFPTAEQSIQIVGEVARKVIEEIAPDGFDVGGDIGVMLGHLTAREAYQAICDAIARAVAAGRLRLERSDFAAEVLFEDERALGCLH